MLRGVLLNLAMLSFGLPLIVGFFGTRILHRFPVNAVIAYKFVSVFRFNANRALTALNTLSSICLSIFR